MSTNFYVIVPNPEFQDDCLNTRFINADVPKFIKVRIGHTTATTATLPVSLTTLRRFFMTQSDVYPVCNEYGEVMGFYQWQAIVKAKIVVVDPTCFDQRDLQILRGD